jgi:hypothetical protein
MRALAASLLLLAYGCASDPLTEIFLSVDVVDMLPEDVVGIAPACDGIGQPPCDGLRIVQLDVHVEGEPAREGLTAIVGPHARRVEVPVSWGIVARDESTTEFEVVVRAYERGPGEDPAVEQRAQVEFVRDEVRTLCMALVPECVGVVCGAGETCVRGMCQPLCLVASALPVFEDGAPCEVEWPVAAGAPCVPIGP